MDNEEITPILDTTTDTPVEPEVVLGDDAFLATLIEDTSNPVEVVVDDPVEKSKPSVDYEGFYGKIMQPFKANGKMIELKDPEEAIQLMQFGANYTKNMQSISKHKKSLLMLEKAELLDEEKLGYLIDLAQGNKGAIQKLLKETEIDPWDLEKQSDDEEYQKGSHVVSDAEVVFKTALDELISDESGVETINLINASWDDTSKEALWNSPELLQVFHTQRSNGIYDTITEEMNRLRTLGQLPSSMPFIEAYKEVGDRIYKQPGKQDGPIETRTVASKKPAASKVAAAKPTTRSPSLTTSVENMPVLDDENFLKFMNGKL